MQVFCKPLLHNLYLVYAIMKCLNLIGQCEASKSLRSTIRGLYMWSPPPKLGAAFATTMFFFMEKSADKNTILLIQSINSYLLLRRTNINKSHHGC